MKLITLILGLVAFVGVGYADMIEVRHYHHPRERVHYVERREVYYVDRPVIRYVEPVYVERPKMKCRPHSHFYWGFGAAPYAAPFFSFGYFHHHHHHR